MKESKEVLKELIKDANWNVNYHKERAKEYELKLISYKSTLSSIEKAECIHKPVVVNIPGVGNCQYTGD